MPESVVLEKKKKRIRDPIESLSADEHNGHDEQTYSTREVISLVREKQRRVLNNGKLSKAIPKFVRLEDPQAVVVEIGLKLSAIQSNLQELLDGIQCQRRIDHLRDVSENWPVLE